MSVRIAAVVSQGQNQNPAKRKFEEDIVTALLLEPAIDVTVVPHLYDLKPNSTGMLALSGISENLIVLSWLYERATRWLLDRNGIRGQVGITTLVTETPQDDDEFDDDQRDLDQRADHRLEHGGEGQGDDTPRVVDHREIPQRKIYCIELGVSQDVDDVVSEIRRIAKENSRHVIGLSEWVGGKPSPDALARFHQPTNDTALGQEMSVESDANVKGRSDNANTNGAAASKVQRMEEDATRRWYPVIDFSRCTNCMECIDFCLFGVYGVDAAETILVEQPDNCRKGCPACSRVCPENAIIFPQHKSPAIAGAPGSDGGGFKIDLSKLFGAPDAVQTAARERDEQLLLSGREAVGMSVGVPKRQSGKIAAPRDDLDELIDTLDELDL